MSSASGRPIVQAMTSLCITTPAGTALATVHTLRQQMRKPPGRPNLALADFVAPRDTGAPDYWGRSRSPRVRARLSRHGFERANDDYSAIMAKALADRLAEAFAERLHERVRTEFWGYAQDETLDNTSLIQEKYQGIRPAPGYPACPDHTEKATCSTCWGPRRTRGSR